MSSLLADRSTRLRVAAALCALAAAGAGVATLILLPPERHRPGVEASEYIPPERLAAADADVQLVRAPLLFAPPSLPAEDSRVEADDPVIGVTADGRHRAYAVGSFEDVGGHVLNDLLGSRPVTVTHCPRTGCTRVFTGDGDHPLWMGVGGWYGKAGEAQMIVVVNRGYYFHTTGGGVAGGAPIPYPTLVFEQTTWGEWKKKHPDTDIYAGGGGPTY